MVNYRAVKSHRSNQECAKFLVDKCTWVEAKVEAVGVIQVATHEEENEGTESDSGEEATANDEEVETDEDDKVSDGNGSDKIKDGDDSSGEYDTDSGNDEIEDDTFVGNVAEGVVGDAGGKGGEGCGKEDTCERSKGNDELVTTEGKWTTVGANRVMFGNVRPIHSPYLPLPVPLVIPSPPCTGGLVKKGVKMKEYYG
ncbi:hypothetical protein U1Q18_028387 [Sarracenia purpurea var. burkii]